MPCASTDFRCSKTFKIIKRLEKRFLTVDFGCIPKAKINFELILAFAFIRSFFTARVWSRVQFFPIPAR